MTHVIRKQPRGPNHPKRRNGSPATSNTLINLIRRRQWKWRAVEPPKLTATYLRAKPLPRNDSRRNHKLLRRLQNRKFVDVAGYLSPTLRQLLANQGLHQMTYLQRKWEDITERTNSVQLPETERQKFNEDFKLWYTAGMPETRENYFWRIRYCGLIELGIDYRYWKTIRQLHEQRHKRGLKNALYRDSD